MRDSAEDAGLSGRSLAFVELPEQVEGLLEELGPSDTIVSCHPSASQALNCAGADYRDIRSFYRHETLWSFYPESVRGLIQAAERIDTIARERWTFLRETGLRASNFVAYQLKIARDQAWYRLFLSRSILDAVGPVDTVPFVVRVVHPIRHPPPALGRVTGYPLPTPHRNNAPRSDEFVVVALGGVT